MDAAVAADVEQARGERRAGRAPRHQRLRVPVRDRPGGLHDRSLGRRANGERWIGGLGDRDRGVDDLHSGRDLADLLRWTEQDHPQPCAHGVRGARCNLQGAQVGPARINGDGDHRCPAVSRSDRPGRRSPRARDRTRKRGRRDVAAGGCDIAGRRYKPEPRVCAGPGGASCERGIASAWEPPFEGSRLAGTHLATQAPIECVLSLWLGRRALDEQMLGEERGELGCPQWVTEQVTLRAVDPIRLKPLRLCLRLHALGDQPRAAYAEQTNDRLQEVGRSRVPGGRPATTSGRA